MLAPEKWIVVDGMRRMTWAYREWSKKTRKRQEQANRRRHDAACYRKKNHRLIISKKTDKLRGEIGKPGFVYFFKSSCRMLNRDKVWYKLGRCCHWHSPQKNVPGRKAAYSGPNKPSTLYFVRPVKNQPYAERVLKNFIRAHDYESPGKRREEWVVRVGEW